MNREILFKGFHPCKNGKDRAFINGEWINGEWVEGYYVKKTGEEKDIPLCGMIREKRYIVDENMGCLQEVIPETVGQYTGLDTDEETTLICKDDIVKFDNGNVCFIGRVDKECGAWGIVADNIPLDCQSDNFISFFEIMWDLGTSDMILDDIVPYVEVIGNIHDNPELLEAAE